MAVLCLIAVAALSQSAAAELLEGVKEISRPGVPGSLALLSETSWPVVAGRVEGYEEPVVGAARWQKGRIVAFAHGGFLGEGAFKQQGLERLLLNSIKWATRPGQRRLLVARNKPLADMLAGKGFSVEGIEAPTADALSKADLLVLDTHDLREQDIAPVQGFVKRGGGLIAAGLGWGWLQLNPGKTIQEHPGNRLLAPAGIMWTAAYTEGTSPGGYAAAEPPSEILAAQRALARLAKGSDSEQRQASWTLSQAVRTAPAEDKYLLGRLDALKAGLGRPIIPSPENPLTHEKPLERLLFTLEMRRLEDTPVDKVRAHPSASGFPGKVTGAQLSPARPILSGLPGWQSTGLYAPPGAKITIRGGRGMTAIIGAHTDTIWHKESWPRAPSISRSFKLSEISLAANPFGGLIYLQGTPAASVVVEGAVAAPRYVLGKTTQSEWLQIRNAGAPWGELETSKLILTLPSSVLAKLDDPGPLMQFWDGLLDTQAELVGAPKKRVRPERIVPDVLISAGYMHAGYPIMTHMDAAPRMASLDVLRAGDWGLLHELGHNLQSPDWTFDGTGEVTNNVIALYTLEAYLGKPWPAGHPALEKSPAKLAQAIAEGRKPWAADDPFLRLHMYVQLKQAFGWDLFKKVFREYQSLPQADKPRTDLERRDQWLVRLSRAAGRNLGPFFEAWGVTTSGAARASVAGLPSWMPPDWPGAAWQNLRSWAQIARAAAR